MSFPNSISNLSTMASFSSSLPQSYHKIHNTCSLERAAAACILTFASLSLNLSSRRSTTLSNMSSLGQIKKPNFINRVHQDCEDLAASVSYCLVAAVESVEEMFNHRSAEIVLVQ